jgi:CBS domain containing-hemolysin-like protein
MNSLTVEDIFSLHKKQESAGERGGLASNLAICGMNNSIASVLNSMMRARSNMVIVCNEKQHYVGIVTIRAIVSSFFD